MAFLTKIPLDFLHLVNVLDIKFFRVVIITPDIIAALSALFKA